jgi:2,3-bisphosphoglycerate-dependent phosphoglycerate mutase
METTRLYLIRHGQSAGNAEGRFGGHSATPLSSLGKRQALLTGRVLSNEKIDAVYSSDLLRAVESAEPLAKSLGLSVDRTNAFRERHVGVLEGLTFDEAKENFPEDFNALVSRHLAHVITGGESYRHLLDRAVAALENILEVHEGGRVAVFAHTGTICFLTLYLLGAIHDGTTHTPWLITSNCGINRFEFRGRDNVRVLALNDTRHLIQVTGNDAFAAR